VPAPPDDARAFLAETTAIEPCGVDGVLLRIRPEAPIPPVRASRFFMLKRADGLSPMIPRPFSLYRQPGAELEFLIKVMGKGTRALSLLRPGDLVRAVGPLGNGWPTLDGDGPPWVLLAGGIGSAPFLLGIEQALAGMDGASPARIGEIHMLYGAQTGGHLYDIERFQRLGVRVLSATMDGSVGYRGHVLGLLEEQWSQGALPREVRLLACGPERMLEAVEHLARERGLACWLSLETLMGCGVGICNGCPIPTLADGPLGSWPNAKCCVEGPVFSLDAVTLAGTPR
jgi:dihydroorotate dehydrogenase electron transfer subunit